MEKIKLESLIPYLDNTVYLIGFLVILTLLIYFFLSLLLKLFFKGSDSKQERKQPSLNEIIDTIKQFNTKLNGVLVDSSRKPLNDEKISQIYVHLKKLEKIMQDKKILSGSDIAEKMFN